MKKLTFLFIFISYTTISKSQSFEWAVNSGGTGFETALSIAVDSDGNTYTGGWFQGTVDFDPGIDTLFLTAAGIDADAFITKFDVAGNLLWAKHFGNTNADPLYDLAIDDSGNVYCTGNFDGSVDFDPGVGVYSLLAMNNDCYILKLNRDGNFVWAKQIPGTSAQIGKGITVDDSSNVYTIGYFSGTSDFDPGIGTYSLTSAGSSDAFISKLNTNGDFVWAKQFGGVGAEAGISITVDSSFNVYTTGTFEGTADFDPSATTYNLIAPGSNAIVFISKLNINGDFVWAKQIGGTGFHFVRTITQDYNGNILVVGNFKSTTDFDPGAPVYNLSSTGSSYDAFISKIDSNGVFVWAKQIGGSGDDDCWGICTDYEGNIYTAGKFSSAVDFDLGIGITNLTATGAYDVFIYKIDEASNFTWVNQIGAIGPAGEIGYSIALDQFNNIYTTGIFYGTADFDPGSSVFPLTTTGGADYYILKLAQDSCSNMSLVIDSTHNVSCISPGYASAHTLNGLQPLSYSWTTPLASDSVVFINNGGIYELVVLAANNCSRKTSIIIDSPPYLSDYDMNSNLLLFDLRVGFPSILQLDVFNDGCTNTPGQLTLILDSLTDYNSAFPTPDNINGDTLMWNFSAISYDSSHFNPTVNLTTSLLANIGDTCYFKIILNPILGDVDTLNNIKNYRFPVIAAYDPNIKSVYPSGYCTPHYIENKQLLTYTVQFQNTGNADAINIFVLDTLDTDLNLSTVRVIGSSDPLITEILPGNVLKFRFDNIFLPDSLSNEPESHGYVIFEVEPVPSLINGTEIKNDVGIYFDFNPPVYTNTVFNTINDGTFFAPVTTTTLTGVTITSDQAGMLYQWIDCTSGDSISGATNQSYIAPQNGSYAVIISDGCDSDTSGCVLVLTTGINDYYTSNFSIYPNPAQNNFIVNTTKQTELSISNLLGEIVLKSNVIDESVIDISHLNNGVYFIRNSEGNSIKFIKQY